MFLILKYVGKKKNEYPAKADYPDLTKQKKISQHSRGAVSIHRINNLDLYVIFRKNYLYIGKYLLLMVLFRFS